MKRCILFAHYDRNAVVDRCVLFYLQELRKFCDHLIFVSTSPLPPEELSKLDGLTDKAITKENEGYDFKSWQVGFSLIPDPSIFDEILICNDSVYGPLYSLAPIFEKMEKSKCDFWGITNSVEVKEHVQSYFVAFRRQVRDSQAFKDFWSDIRPQKTKKDVVTVYELGLTQCLLKAGFNYEVVSNYRRFRGLLTIPRAIVSKIIYEWVDTTKIYPSKQSDGMWAALREAGPRYFQLLFHKVLVLSFNPTVYHWREVLREGCPFIKVAVLREKSVHVSTKGWENEVENFGYMPLNLIEANLKRTKV